jgi:tetratricopeptide (TPR) repeat protein
MTVPDQTLSKPLEQSQIDAVLVIADPAGSRARIGSILENTDGMSSEHFLEWKTLLARTYSLQHNIGESLAILADVECQLGTATPIARVRWALERGRTWLTSGDREKARADFHTAYKDAQTAGHTFLAVDAVHMLGIAHDGNEALDWNMLAIAMINESPDEAVKRWLGPLLNNTGWTYFDMGEYEKARSLFAMDVEYRTSKGLLTQARVARYSLARTMRAQGQIVEALAIQRANAEEIRTTNGDPDGYIDEEIGECLLMIGRMEEARGYLASAYELLSADPWMQDNQPDRLLSLQTRAGLA